MKCASCSEVFSCVQVRGGGVERSGLMAVGLETLGPQGTDDGDRLWVPEWPAGSSLRLPGDFSMEAIIYSDSCAAAKVDSPLPLFRARFLLSGVNFFFPPPRNCLHCNLFSVLCAGRGL